MAECSFILIGDVQFTYNNNINIVIISAINMTTNTTATTVISTATTSRLEINYNIEFTYFRIDHLEIIWCII